MSLTLVTSFSQTLIYALWILSTRRMESLSLAIIASMPTNIRHHLLLVPYKICSILFPLLSIILLVNWIILMIMVQECSLPFLAILLTDYLEPAMLLTRMVELLMHGFIIWLHWRYHESPTQYFGGGIVHGHPAFLSSRRAELHGILALLIIADIFKQYHSSTLPVTTICDNQVVSFKCNNLSS